MGDTDERAGYPLRVPIESIQRLEALLEVPGVERLRGLEGAAKVSRSALVRLALRRGLDQLESDLKRIERRGRGAQGGAGDDPAPERLEADALNGDGGGR